MVQLHQQFFLQAYWSQSFQSWHHILTNYQRDIHPIECFYQLVRFYKFAGFEIIREVSQGSLVSLPDLIVWGGEGTRMDVNIEKFLKLWTPRIRTVLDRKNNNIII